MLINKGVVPGEVITLKLTSGEELVAKLEDETSTHYVLDRTRVVGMGQKGPGLMPYLFTVNPNATIRLAKIATTVVEPSDPEFAKQYLELTSSIALV